MDFWSRLVAGTALAPKKASANTPEKRLARFKKGYSQLLASDDDGGSNVLANNKRQQIWRNTSNLATDAEAAEELRAHLQELTSLISDEARRPLPHPCIACAAHQQVYIPAGKIAGAAHAEGVIREGVALFAALADAEDAALLEDAGFARSLTTLLGRVAGAHALRLARDTEADVVELAFNITTKIRLDPRVLPAWFVAGSPRGSRLDLAADERAARPRADVAFAGRTHKEDFPLFYLLIDYIHHEGRIGDFARTGLLYIIEAASSSLPLEQWLVESDLATLMATGLGALYSQLSRKLVIDLPPDELPPVLAFSDYKHPVTSADIVGSTSIEFQGHMETFLSHLMFWQDVLNHCKSSEVKQTLLDHFQIIFLQQLLYPSLLESSDIDGGSSVAVLTYLRRILEALDHPDMIHLILQYLFALPVASPTSSGSKGSISAARRRKSLDLATMMASNHELPSTPALFTLVDLIEGSLRSSNQQTIAVTLQLISTILRRHHRYAVTTLFRTNLQSSESPRRTMGAHERQLEFVLDLAGSIGGDDDFDAKYDDHLHDCMVLIESHPCSLPLLTPAYVTSPTRLTGAQASCPDAPRDVRPHTLRPDDPVLEILDELLRSFFINAVDTNLSLTGALTDLITCGQLHIDGWLLLDPAACFYDESPEPSEEPANASSDDPELLHLEAIKMARRRPNLDKTPLPMLLQTLQQLVRQVVHLSTTIPRFTALLQQRRDAFSTAAIHLDSNPPTPQLSSPSHQDASMDSSQRQSALDALTSKLFPDLSNPSRSNSPRGRTSEDRSSSRHEGAGTRAPTKPSTLLAPTSRLEALSRASSASRSTSQSRSEVLLDIPISQTIAFSNIDQSILARKVAMPDVRMCLEEEEGSIGRVDTGLTDAVTKSSSGGPMISESNTLATATPSEIAQPKTSDSQFEPSTAEPTTAEPTTVETTTEAITKNDSTTTTTPAATVSVSHVLTNTLILQDFLLELAAVIQVRAALFDEVRSL